MDRFKPREDRFAFIVALGRTFISLQERSPDDLSTTDNVERGPQQLFFSQVPLEQWRKGPLFEDGAEKFVQVRAGALGLVRLLSSI